MQNQAKGAKAWFMDLAHIFHVAMTWGSIHKSGITLVQASFLCAPHGGTSAKPFSLPYKA